MSSDGQKQMKAISENLQILLKEHNMTQAELGAIVGVSESAVGKWILCRNAPSMGNIQKIANHFNLNKSDILEPYINKKRRGVIYFDKDFELTSSTRVLKQDSKMLFGEQLRLYTEPRKDSNELPEYTETYSTAIAAAGAGANNELHQDAVLHIIRRSDAPDKYDAQVDVTGDSMEPTIRHMMTESLKNQICRA